MTWLKSLITNKSIFFICLCVYHVIFCAIWYHLHNFKNVENTYGGVLLLVKFQALAATVVVIVIVIEILMMIMIIMTLVVINNDNNK